MEGGMECVVILGTTRMPLWCAENWDILQQVCVHDNSIAHGAHTL